MKETPETAAALPDLSQVALTKAEPPTCGGCRFFVPTSPDQKVGRCQRNPPSPMLVGVGQGLHGKQVPIVDGYFAPTNTSIWCGEFQERFEPLPVPDFATVGDKQ